MNNLKNYTRESHAQGKDGYRNGQRIPHEDIQVIPEKFNEDFPIRINNVGLRKTFTEKGTFGMNTSNKDIDLYEPLN